MKQLKPSDFKGSYKVKVKTGSLSACVHCLPISPMEGHPMLYGVLVHSRVDVPRGKVYIVNEAEFVRR